MTTEVILTRMMSDPAFAEAVFTNAEKALAEYNLSADELAKFKGLTRAEFQVIVAGERKSLGGPGDPTDMPPGSKNHNETIL